MKRAVISIVKTCGRPVKRVLEKVIDNWLVDYHMPTAMPGDLLLTFDDGPHPEYTPRLLDLLDEYGARAVFFIIGSRAALRPDLVQACHDRGHVIANHTYTHLNDGVGGRYSRDQVTADIGQCGDLLRQATGLSMSHFRPPRGELNAKTWGAARDNGLRIMMWSVEGGEWGVRSDWSSDQIGDYLTRKVKKRDIVLLHDDNEKTLPAVAALLQRLAKERFDLASAAVSLRPAEPTVRP